MKTNSLLSALTAILILTSCNTYKEYDKESFPNYIWDYGQEIVFKPVIENIDKSYNLSLGIRHIYGFRLSNLLVTVKSISPSGKEDTKEYDLKIMNEPGKYVGSCAGDMCDLETLVNENIKFDEAGEYQFIVTHNVQINRLPGVMEFGLIIDEN
jgi:gliding motility-associated lipoprotein GldH